MSARRSPLAVGACAVAVLVAAASPAVAQDDILESAPSETPLGKRYHSPQHFAVEVKFGPYRPDVDSEFSGPNPPYKSYFGDNRHLMSQLEFDWQVFRKLGSLAAGFTVGYFSVTGPSPLGNGTGQLSGDTSSLRVIPLSLAAVYRFDYLLETRNIPVVPFGKLGLDYAFWTITDGNGEVAEDVSGKSGQGGTLGWHASAGLALVLDWLDPDAARDFDSDLGVNHTAITFEYTHADISGLGQAKRLHVGDTTWTLGLLLEF
jgi:hypothetical protein